jgi:hypothetical protein
VPNINAAPAPESVHEKVSEAEKDTKHETPTQPRAQRRVVLSDDDDDADMTSESADWSEEESTGTGSSELDVWLKEDVESDAGERLAEGVAQVKISSPDGERIDAQGGSDERDEEQKEGASKKGKDADVSKAQESSQKRNA